MDFVLVALTAKPNGFWPGWKASRHVSVILQITREGWKSAGVWATFGLEFSLWINLVFAAAFFAIYGLTRRKRTFYQKLFWTILKPFGLKPRADPEASVIVFGTGPVINSRAVDEEGVATM